MTISDHVQSAVTSRQ